MAWSSAKITAINSLVQHEFITPLSDKLVSQCYSLSDLWKFAPGYSSTSLNFMLCNMLISQYYIGSVVKNTTDNKWYPATKDDVTGGYTLGAVPVVSLTNLPYNYDAKKIFESWTSALELINSFDTQSDVNILGEDIFSIHEDFDSLNSQGLNIFKKGFYLFWFLLPLIIYFLTYFLNSEKLKAMKNTRAETKKNYKKLTRL